MKTTAGPTRLKETVELADELHANGVLDDATDLADHLSHPIVSEADATGANDDSQTTVGPTRVKETLALADELRAEGVINDEAYRKITMREFGRTREGFSSPGVARSIYPAITGDEIRAERERAKMSQAVFARLLNLTVGYVSQLERGARRPTGATLALLDVVRRKGIEAIL